MFRLNFFDTNLNVQTTGMLSSEMKEYYDKNIIKNAIPNLVHDQFGQKRPIPKNGGKTIKFRRLAPLEKAVRPLTEGVTPKGTNLHWSEVSSTLNQYGNYVTISDTLSLTALDNNLVEAGEILGAQAGETLDSITREVLNSGTNVQYSNGAIARDELRSGRDYREDNNYLSVDCIKKAVRTLKTNKAKKINGYYVGIIHPDVAYDLTDDPKWENVKQYADPKDWYEGEIGKIYGVRFIETSEAKVFTGDALTISHDFLTVQGVNKAEKRIYVNETIPGIQYQMLMDRQIRINGKLYSIVGISGSTNSFVVWEDITDNIPIDAMILPDDGYGDKSYVYSTLILGADAYGVTELEGGGLQNIIKQLGSAGTGDPLNQRATTGWKAYKTAEILVQEYMVRIESTSSRNRYHY